MIGRGYRERKEAGARVDNRVRSEIWTIIGRYMLEGDNVTTSDEKEATMLNRRGRRSMRNRIEYQFPGYTLQDREGPVNDYVAFIFELMNLCRSRSGWDEQEILAKGDGDRTTRRGSGWSESTFQNLYRLYRSRTILNPDRKPYSLLNMNPK